ncbi:ankyrin repeat domain-containing protein [Streptomyces johnsoniae]|uniref:Ankyrin repeat domain-containing protein n=1 Tax=Streptomyces johnsoniae TaxID=3075532 RepID=A0ABU2SCM2_9ACTN|nr:ankyrin repeat domain-containing protein [Streptomyces sp. DSM 41886]MDT0446647.1 ankyrin repeat domain-containing protein [Streptomyces sp. DSM 41886]
MAGTETTRALVVKLFADVADGNVDGVLGAMSPDVVLEFPGNDLNALIPGYGVWEGRAGFAEHLRLRSAFVDIVEFRRRGIVVDGDHAVVATTQLIRHRAGGTLAPTDFTTSLTYGEEGLVTHCKVVFDSSAEVAMYQAETNALLLPAIRSGDLGEVRRILGHRADPNQRDGETGLTALQTAAGLGAGGVVRALIEAGADVHSGDSRAGGTALHKAVQRGDLDTIRALVAAGAFVDAVAPTTGHTPLMDALWYKWPDVVAYLLELDAGLGLHTHYGFSLREHFEYELNVNTLGKEKLLAAEKLLADRTRGDERAAEEQRLMAAVTAGDTAAVRARLAEGAPVDARFPVVNGFNDAHTPLLVACRDGHTDIVRELLAAGADVNASEPTFGAVPLHKAVYNGHADITRLLAEAPGTDLDFQGATNGYTPLHDALWHGYEDCARVLLAAGARTDLVGHDGKTPRDIAAETFGAGHPLVAELGR